MTWDLLEEAKKMIAIRSISQEGNRAAVQFVAPFCEKLGFNLTFQAPAGGSTGEDLNLIAHTVPPNSGDLCPKGLLWVTHLDTVPPGDLSLWTETGGDPYCATIKGEKLYGLGSADTKVDILCKLKAIETVGLKNVKIPFALVGSYGEERGLAGIKRLRESEVMHPRFALVSEASDLRPVLKHKGILYMKLFFNSPLPQAGEGLGVRELTFHGKAAHGSTPHLGDNAIEKAFQWLFEEQAKEPNLQLISVEGGTVHNIVPEKCLLKVAKGANPSPQIDFLKKFWQIVERVDQFLEKDRDEAFDPPVTTRNIGVIRQEGDRLLIEFDYRLIPSTEGNTLFALLKEIGQIAGAELKVLSSNPPLDTSLQSEIVERVTTALRSVGSEISFPVKSGNTEGAILAMMGAEAVVIGPGKAVGNIHKPNEHNEISQLQRAVDFYTAFLRQFC
ncbi:MAG: M20/M25/M40 family metallo-hydrolase [Deltaproteobacteria bacterium]|nr:M20/M25/M40 family metallo-hydrolase [Deltaproteobacteria bacterium]